MSITERIIARIKSQFEGEATGHDWHHIMRVLNISRRIHKTEGGDLQIIELAALLHDISDYKFNGGNLDKGGELAYSILIEEGCNDDISLRVKYIVDNISYKGANTIAEMNSLEGKIVQDADRIDAIGAIGIARTFAYGGHKGQPIYDPDVNPTLHNTAKEYTTSNTSTINHFYEKLLLLTDRMNTQTGRKIANERHNFMQSFLNQFFLEWNIKEEESNED